MQCNQFSQVNQTQAKMHLKQCKSMFSLSSSNAVPMLPNTASKIFKGAPAQSVGHGFVTLAKAGKTTVSKLPHLIYCLLWLLFSGFPPPPLHSCNRSPLNQAVNNGISLLHIVKSGRYFITCFEFEQSLALFIYNYHLFTNQ